MRPWWHYGWAAIVVGTLLLNVFWPVSPGFSEWGLSLIPYPIAAAVILTNRPGNRVGAALAVVGVAAGVIFVGSWAAWTWPGANRARIWRRDWGSQCRFSSGE